MRILVAYASKHGGTEGLARAIAARLREAGHTANAVPARSVDKLDDFDAVIVGGGLYAGRWPWQAVRFVQRFLDELCQMPVWLFSSGPLDHSASHARIPPLGPVAHWVDRTRARGHMTFGGKLDPATKGFFASAMVKNGLCGDFRDWQQVDAWADAIALQLESQLSPVEDRERARSVTALRRRVIVLTALSGAFALLGGIELMTLPRSGPLLATAHRALEHTPFATFFWPGLILAACVGMSNLIAALTLTLRMRHTASAAALSGAMMSAFVVVESIALRTFSTFELCLLAAGIVITTFALQLRSREPAQQDQSTHPPNIGARTSETG
jgi:menaquinone-dependent protoporphyrinogen oxidase